MHVGEMKIFNQIIIFGSDNYNTLGLIRVLGGKKMNIHLILVNAKHYNYCHLSKYVCFCNQVNSIDEGIEYLLRNVNSDHKQFIIPTGDDVESALDNNFNKLFPYYTFPHASKEGQVNKLMDKLIMTEIARNCGLTVPSSNYYTCGNPLPVDISFPCFVKPLISIEGAKRDMGIVNSLEELRTITNNKEAGYRYLIQQYVKSDYDILILGCRKLNGDVFVSGVFKKTRWVGTGNDGSFGEVSSDYEQYISKGVVKSFLSSLNYYGPFSIECGVSSGEAYFYEINMRNDGTTHYFQYFKNSVPCIWMGTENEVDESKDISYHFIDEYNDILNVFRGECSFRQWFRDIKGANVYKYWDSKDILPSLVAAPLQIALTANRFIKILRGRY